MKKICRWSLLVLIFPLMTLQSQALSSRETVLQLLKDYSPDSYYMVDQYLKMPEVIEKHMHI